MKNILFLFIILISSLGFTQDPGEMVYDSPTQMPVFPGGGTAMDQFVKNTMQYPAAAKKENNIQGKVYVQFIVEKDGTISNIEIRRGSNELLNKEAMRIIGLMPAWEPGKNMGKIVRTRYTVPVVFTI